MNNIQLSVGDGTITGAINALNTDITVAFGNATPINSTLSSDFSVAKMGDFAFAHGQIHPQKAFDADTYILLARFSPVQSQKTYFPVAFSDGIAGFGYIDGNGDIYVKKCGKLMQASDWITLNFTYKIS